MGRVSGRVRRPSGWKRYGWALLAVVLALLARWFADPRLGSEQVPYGSMLVATVIVVWFAGMRPALVVVFLGGPAANFFLLPPRWSFAVGAEHQSWALVVFLILGSMLSGLGGYINRQRARSEDDADTIRRAEAALREAHNDLECRVEQRTAELARSNHSLRESEERFRLLVEGIKGHAMLMLDDAGAIVAWNAGAERLFARSADIVGQSLGQLIPGLEREDLVELAPGGTAEYEGLRSDGARFPIELEVTRLDPPGLFVGIVRDISERRRLEELSEQRQRKADELAADNRRMQEASRLQTEFLANMSHELRTPLNAIIGFADLLHGGMVGTLEAQQREFIGDILRSSRHLLHLINDVLDLAKIESGSLQVVPERVDVARVIGEVRDVVRGLASDRRIDLELQLCDGLGSATVDPAKLRQIVYNYLSNALKFTPEGGRVVVRAATAGDSFRIEVEDTGIGIASDDLRYLFLPFRQLDAGATKRYAGTGLGLALTKRLAEAHGGSVGVHSVCGTGSTFWVELPRAAIVEPVRRAFRR